MVRVTTCNSFTKHWTNFSNLYLTNMWNKDLIEFSLNLKIINTLYKHTNAKLEFITDN